MQPAYILSGGRSSRFGSDKARYQTPSGPQLSVLANQLRAAGHIVHFVADRADRYADLGVTCLVDVQPDSGPLSGLASALQHSGSQLNPEHSNWVLLLSCDQRNWQTAWYDQLVSHVHDAASAVVYFDDQWQPMPGLYHVDLLSTVVQRLQNRRLSMHGLLDAIEQRAVKVHTTQPPSRWSFNTLAELE